MSVQGIEIAISDGVVDPALKLLIDQQGVKPVVDLNQLASLWPADDDPDELMTFILTERTRRNQAAERKGEGG